VGVEADVAGVVVAVVEVLCAGDSGSMMRSARSEEPEPEPQRWLLCSAMASPILVAWSNIGDRS